MEFARPRNIDDVATALAELETTLPKLKLDLVRNFNRAYLIITQNVRTELQKGQFIDPTFLNQFDARFAEYYLRALRDYVNTGQTVPAWQATFKAAEKDSASPLRYMALGVNAHVNNDIPQVLRDCNAQSLHRKDYFMVNKIIKKSIYEVLNALDADHRAYGVQRRLLQPFYKFFMALLIRLWRWRAWHNHMRQTSVDAIERSAQRLASGIQYLPL